MLVVFSAADFEDFRPDMPPQMETELRGVVRILAENRWPWRLHATFEETIARALDVFERVDRDIPLAGLNWFFDHAETISERSIDCVAALGGGIAVQHRVHCLDRETALRMWTENVTWFSNEEGKKGRIQVGQFAEPDRPRSRLLLLRGRRDRRHLVGPDHRRRKSCIWRRRFRELRCGSAASRMADRSPVRRFGGYGAWRDSSRVASSVFPQRLALHLRQRLPDPWP
jgi:Amidohydrolase family